MLFFFLFIIFQVTIETKRERLQIDEKRLFDEGSDDCGFRLNRIDFTLQIERGDADFDVATIVFFHFERSKGEERRDE